MEKQGKSGNKWLSEHAGESRPVQEWKETNYKDPIIL